VNLGHLVFGLSVIFDVKDAVDKQGFLQTRTVDADQLESH
jgi:hypothetical protein